MNAGPESVVSPVEELACELCIVGAGIAGLNALFVATRYLARGQKVVLVDRNARVGGMWLSTYDYVRLHQPHPMFTAGNIAWTLGKPPSHLAERDEILAHLRHCFAIAQEHLRVDERYGYDYRSHDESGAGPDEVLVLCAPTSPGAPSLRIKTKKLIKAFGHDIKAKEPLALSSANVRSVSPEKHDLLGEEMRASDAPVYIVGGGKTGMDTAYELVTRFPSKKVSLLIGEGTMFSCREKLFPVGWRRWWAGTTTSAAFLDLSQRFDGNNEREVLDHFLATYGVSVVPDARRYMLGALSERENSIIAGSVHEVTKDYLVDVADRDGQPTLLLRSGASRAIAPGSWVVNCTGHLAQETIPYEPYVSESGKVVSIQNSSSIHALTTASSYFLTHLSYQDQLLRVPLYELDVAGTYHANRDVFAAVLGPHSLHNVCLILDAVPRSVFDEFGADIDRWYPLHRRLYSMMRLLSFRRRNPDHWRRSLDTVRERFGVRCNPLPHVARA